MHRLWTVCFDLSLRGNGLDRKETDPFDSGHNPGHGRQSAAREGKARRLYESDAELRATEVTMATMKVNMREEIVRKGAQLIHAQGYKATGL